MTNLPTNVGFIGLGAMGQGMARNLAKHGTLSTIFNRSRQKSDKLAEELSCSVSDTVEQLAEISDVILLCVSADEDVLEVINAICRTIRPSTIVIDLSTVSRETAEKSSTILAKKQACYLDAPVSGGTEGAAKGTLSIMIGGDIHILNQIKPILTCIGNNIVHMGKTGSGQATKAVNQIMAAGINQAVTEALAFSEGQGLDMDKVIDVISAGAAGNWFLQHRGKTMIKGLFPPGFKLALHHKDLTICKKMAESVQIATPLVDQTLIDYDSLINQGYSDEDISALFRLKTKRLD